MKSIPAEKRHLALASVQVVQMWSDGRYRAFLHQNKPGELTAEWFQWFVGAWKVARTIKDGHRELVREYLNQDLRKRLSAGGGARAVDAAAQFIQEQGWSSTTRKNGQGSLPISLVSKIGFLFCPDELVPLDRYAVEGLNRIRRGNGLPRLKGQAYREYLEGFNELYAAMEPLLASALNESWITVLAGKLGCPANALQTIAMRRKLLDNYLMHSGEYSATW